MTRADIIRMAKEAGFDQILPTNAGADEWVDDGFYVKEMERFAALVAAAEKELIAQWVESWGNDLTIKEIVEGIRTDGNGATRPLKYVTREEPL